MLPEKNIVYLISGVKFCFVILIYIPIRIILVSYLNIFKQSRNCFMGKSAVVEPVSMGLQWGYQDWDIWDINLHSMDWFCWENLQERVVFAPSKTSGFPPMEQIKHQQSLFHRLSHQMGFPPWLFPHIFHRFSQVLPLSCHVHPLVNYTKSYWKWWFTVDLSRKWWFSIAFCMFTRPGTLCFSPTGCLAGPKASNKHWIKANRSAPASRRRAKGCRIPRAVLGSAEPTITYHIICIYIYIDIMYICIYILCVYTYKYIYLICILYTRCFSSTLHVANENPSNSL